MSHSSKSHEGFASKIRDALQDIAPEGTQFMVVYVLPEDDHVGITTNMTDKTAEIVLQGAMDSIHDSPPILIDNPNKDVN